MRRTYKARGLVLAMFAVPLVLSTVVVAGTASASNKHPKPMSVTCQTVSGTYNGSWRLLGCSQPETITGGASNSITPNFSTAMTSVTVSWDRTGSSVTAHTTRMAVSVFPTRHNACGKGNSEYEVLGSATANKGDFVGVKLGSKVKFFVCKMSNGSVTNTIKGKLRKARF